MSVLEIPLGKELTVNCLVETSMVNGFSYNGMSWAIVIREHQESVLKLCGITKSGRHSALKITFFFFNCSEDSDEIVECDQCGIAVHEGKYSLKCQLIQCCCGLHQY